MIKSSHRSGGRSPQRTEQRWRVLSALDILNEKHDAVHGLMVCRHAGLKSGTVYPMLRDFVDRKWVIKLLEDIDPKVAGRPRRTFYELTANGRAEISRYSDLVERRGWAYA